MHFQQLRYKIGAILLILSLFLVSTPAQRAFAGSNGQQLQIGWLTCSPNYGLVSVYLNGPNQHGTTQPWQWQSPSGYNSKTKSVTTTNFWWKGSVSYTIYVSYGAKFTGSVSVPPTYATDNYPLDVCKLHL